MTARIDKAPRIKSPLIIAAAIEPNKIKRLVGLLRRKNNASRCSNNESSGEKPTMQRKMPEIEPQSTNAVSDSLNGLNKTMIAESGITIHPVIKFTGSEEGAVVTFNSCLKYQAIQVDAQSIINIK